ncbi:MAG: hypothetical protein HPY57_13150 [Ignavibacteria bacterium]|nr:hypothetical protein [Ignavibacteria bacterium]
MSEYIKIVENFSITAVTLGMLIYYVQYLLKQHKKERDEWREENQKNLDNMTRVIKENTDVLSGLKSLLESIDRRIK